MTQQTEAQKLIELAADYLEQYGWMRGGSNWRVGLPRCVVGALDYARFVLDNHPAFLQAQMLLIVSGVAERGSISAWNDARHQTRPNVTRTLYRIAGVEEI